MTSPYSIILIRFNNYNNRILKKFDNFQDYINDRQFYGQSQVNFKFGDGITTKMIVGTDKQPLQECDYDYLLVLKEGEIHSRWFILEAVYKSSIQYELTLKRDVLADFKDELFSSRSIIQKANINDWRNPLIFNNEGITFNQIKKKEILLKDETNTNWIVGYIANSYAGSESISSINNSDDNITDLSDVDIRFNDETNPLSGGYFDVFGTDKINLSIGFRCFHYANLLHYFSLLTVDFNNIYSAQRVTRSLGSQLQSAITLNQRSDLVDEVTPLIQSNYFRNLELMEIPLKNYLESVLNYQVVSDNDVGFIRSLDGQKVSYNNRYYIINISEPIDKTSEVYLSGLDNELQLLSSLKFITQEAASEESGLIYEDNDRAYRIKASIKRYSFSLVETTGPNQLSVTIPAARQQLIDAPYDMFCMKYSLDNLALATAIGEELGENIYDIQILPYCPARTILDNILDNSQAELSAARVTQIMQEENVVDYLYWCSTSTMRFTIPVNDEIFKINYDPISLKIKNETELFRLTSPNYNGAFDFSVAKNFGVDSFIVSCTYKPIAPYIQVAPSFKGLYGSNFNDGRGLICNGDFSMARINDQWANYEINNKNYQNIFDTQIKTMDKNNALAVTQNVIGAGLNAASTGIVAGGLLGSAGLGAGVGLVSAAAGGLDVMFNQMQYQNNRAAQIDIWNYQLGNIKARPDTLTKISSINVNNKYFPFVEYYSATETEIEIFRSKLEWDGMTIMSIDTVSNWTDSKYIKGEILRIEINEDSHIATEIALEFKKGVYLT